MNLKGYEQEKFAIADIIRSAQAVDTKDDTLQSECRDLLTRLAEDRFNLMIVGRFSRGKSTLMNAVLGGDYLPTGIVPLTSVITTVRYGSRKQVVLTFNDSRLRREVPLSQLADYVTQQSNPGNVKDVAYAEIELPVEILRRGLFFVDSPGLGSSIVENTQTTERFLPQADAFVLVTSYESPLSEEEDRILHRIPKPLRDEAQRVRAAPRRDRQRTARQDGRGGGTRRCGDGRTVVCKDRSGRSGSRGQQRHPRQSVSYSQQALPDTTCTKTGTRRKLPPARGRQFTI